ncbi:hypothetical protein [Terrabacter sp. NPDC080008]|uniref:hypothetical protein n=1 Tax=Terrabacter sp. NPDC080008 TaxID=3155176 RepID=UPI003450D54A
MRVALRPFLAFLAVVVTALVAAPTAGATQRGGASSVASAAGATTAAAVNRTRAMWVWDTSTPQATVDLAVSSGIGQLYVAVPPNLATSSQLPDITTLSQRARAAGIRVDALGGDPTWVDNASWVVTYWLKPAKSSGLFTGIHTDVEPYSLPAWTTKQSTVVASYLTLLDKLNANAGSMPIESDIPFWFGTIAAKSSTGASSTLDREIMKRTAGVTVMAYRNTATGPDGTLDVASTELAAGSALGKPVRLGQETTHLGDTAVDRKQTFFGWTRTDMEAQLALVDSGASAYSSYAGLALHDASGYAAMAS